MGQKGLHLSKQGKAELSALVFTVLTACNPNRSAKPVNKSPSSSKDSNNQTPSTIHGSSSSAKPPKESDTNVKPIPIVDLTHEYSYIPTRPTVPNHSSNHEKGEYSENVYLSQNETHPHENSNRYNNRPTKKEYTTHSNVPNGRPSNRQKIPLLPTPQYPQPWRSQNHHFNYWPNPYVPTWGHYNNNNQYYNHYDPMMTHDMPNSYPAVYAMPNSYPPVHPAYQAYQEYANNGMHCNF